MSYLHDSDPTKTAACSRLGKGGCFSAHRRRGERNLARHYYGRSRELTATSSRDVVGDEEIRFIQERDSFYMATVSESGWPYIQHRGGKPGFLRLRGQNALGFADYKGNRQLLSTGNLATNNRVALFLMDYPNQSRLKILGHASVKDAREHPELVIELVEPELHPVVERLFLIEVDSYDWNCSQYITRRFPEPQVASYVASLKKRIAELEAKLSR